MVSHLVQRGRVPSSLKVLWYSILPLSIIQQSIYHVVRSDSKSPAVFKKLLSLLGLALSSVHTEVQNTCFILDIKTK